MAVISLGLLKTKFETGDRPTGADYSDLIDTTSYYATSLESRVEALEATGESLIEATISSSSPTVVHQWAADSFTTIEYIIQIIQGTKFYACKILLLNNSTDIDYTKYGIISLGDDMSDLAITSEINGDFGQLLVTISDANTTSAYVKVIKTAIA